MKTAKNTLKIAGLGLFTLMAAACNTVAGAGEDIQAGGDVVEDTADAAGIRSLEACPRGRSRCDHHQVREGRGKLGWEGVGWGGQLPAL